MSLAYDSTQTLDAPLEAGQRVGTVTAMYQNIELATAELVTLTAVEREGIAPTVPEETQKPAQTESASDSGLMQYWYLVVPIAVLLVLLCLLLILRAVNVRRAKKRAAQRRRRMQQRRDDDV